MQMGTIIYILTLMWVYSEQSRHAVLFSQCTLTSPDPQEKSERTPFNDSNCNPPIKDIYILHLPLCVVLIWQVEFWRYHRCLLFLLHASKLPASQQLQDFKCYMQCKKKLTTGFLSPELGEAIYMYLSEALWYSYKQIARKNPAKQHVYRCENEIKLDQIILGYFFSFPRYVNIWPLSCIILLVHVHSPLSITQTI